MTARDAMYGGGSAPAAPAGHEGGASGRIGAGARPVPASLTGPRGAAP